MSDEKKPIRVRIQHDGGMAYNAHVTDAETGKEISHVKAVELRLDASEKQPAIAHLEVYMPVIDVTVDAEVTTLCPYCGRPLLGDELNWRHVVDALLEIAPPGEVKTALFARYQRLLKAGAA